MMSDIRKAILIVIVVSVAAACKKDPVSPPDAENAVFSIELPADYILVPGQGIDSYVGTYTGSRGNIHFDCGYFSFGNMEDIEAAGTSYYEETIIDNTAAKIVMQDRSDGQHLSLYINKDGDWRKVLLHTSNPNKENFFFFCKVFKSLKFK